MNAAVAATDVQASMEVGPPTEAHERGAFAGEVHCDQVVHVLGPTKPKLNVAELADAPAAPQASTFGEVADEVDVVMLLQVSCTRRAFSEPGLGSPKIPLSARNCEHVCVPTTHHVDTMAVLSTPRPLENGGKP
jgi:hypothetical protein